MPVSMNLSMYRNTNEMFFIENSRKDGRQGEHISCQVGEVSQDEDKAWLNDLDIFSVFTQ